MKFKIDFKVGDEVVTKHGDFGIITNVCQELFQIKVMTPDGFMYGEISPYWFDSVDVMHGGTPLHWIKTGYNYPEMKAILDRMKERYAVRQHENI